MCVEALKLFVKTAPIGQAAHISRDRRRHCECYFFAVGNAGQYNLFRNNGRHGFGNLIRPCPQKEALVLGIPADADFALMLAKKTLRPFSVPELREIIREFRGMLKTA